MLLPRVSSLVLLALLSSALALPVQQQAEKPLLRVKRAEEMTFGNHQNSARVKKTDPAMNVEGNEDAVIDQNASVEAKSEPLPEEDAASNVVKTEADDARPEPDDVDTIIDDVKSGLSPIAAENDLATLQGQKEENMLDELEHQESQETLTEEEAKELEEEQEKEHEEAEEAADAEEQATEQASQESTQQAEPSESWYDYFNYDGYYPKYFVNDNDRRKRSAQAMAPMTAENMMAAGPQRFKRDLTEDELREWLEEEGANPSMGEETAVVPYDEEEVLTRNEEQLLERLLEDEVLAEMEPDVVEEEEQGYYPSVLEEDSVDPEAEAKAKMALLEYLYQALPEQVEEQVEEELYEPEEAQIEAAPEVEYQPIVYDGVPGIFIPVKRQYLSMVPGIRKRGSDFYPYQYEPSSAGRWGALIPEMNEQKRNAEAYERLYRMAEALRRDDDDYWYNL